MYSSSSLQTSKPHYSLSSSTLRTLRYSWDGSRLVHGSSCRGRVAEAELGDPRGFKVGGVSWGRVL